MGMNLDEDKPIDVRARLIINQQVFIIMLLASIGSILLTGILFYFFASGFIPTISCLVVGMTLLFFSIYFPVQSNQLFQIKTEIIDIEDEEFEELQSVMKPW